MCQQNKGLAGWLAGWLPAVFFLVGFM